MFAHRPAIVGKSIFRASYLHPTRTSRGWGSKAGSKNSKARKASRDGLRHPVATDAHIQAQAAF
eukprot:12886564-Prorocentrum_lima.AAC.1